MSIISSKRTKQQLSVDVNGPFNYFTVELIRAQLHENIQILVINMTQCEILDSEAAIFLYKSQKSDIKLKLINPPQVLFSILSTLHLEKSWNVPIIHENH